MTVRPQPPRPSAQARSRLPAAQPGPITASLYPPQSGLRLGSPAARRALDAWIAQAALETGLAAREYREALARGDAEPTYRVSVDLWRALDAAQGRTDPLAHASDRAGAPSGSGSTTVTTVPQWLLGADREAEAQLAQWYPLRGLCAPSDTEDPGEPGGDQYCAEEAVITYPRAYPNTPRERLIEWLKCRRDPVYFLDNYGHLSHKVRGVIPFRLWKWQAWLLHRWHQNPLSITLKARQLGASELAAGYSAWTILFHDTKNVLLLSKREDDAVALLERAVTCLDFLPDWLRPGSEQSVSVSYLGRRNTTVFGIAHMDADGRVHPSTILSLPATMGAGRSLTAALVILDEWAYQMWATPIWTSIKPTADGGGRIIGLSTANGVGNLFHQLWVYATDGIGSAGEASADGAVSAVAGVQDDRANRFGKFFAAFLSWRRHPERDQAWYDAEAAEKGRINQSHLLHQEYPSEPTQAFVQSGRNVFDSQYLTRHSERIKAEIRERHAAGLPPWRTIDGLTIYEPPQDAVIDSQTGQLVSKRHQYILTADVAEGLAHGDYDDAFVIDRETGLEVASLHGHWPPDEYARRLDKLGREYFDALLAVERNNHGHAVLLALNSIHRYPNLYHHADPHVPGRPADRRAGWPTTPTSKPLAVDKLRELLAGDLIFPRSTTFLNQALVYAYQENGSMSAPEGYHDDMVAAFWIAAYLLTKPELTSVAMDFIRGRAGVAYAGVSAHALGGSTAVALLPAGVQVKDSVSATEGATYARQHLGRLLGKDDEEEDGKDSA